ncbi:MAG TPA: hypothetical protein VMX17_04570 [Candidatus Glassbacteria bacterium]|nr:hypothetical protein [Candidatus Glassbacteria bacterium]
MKNFSPHEEQLIKESAEWFNKTITKIKSRKDPYRDIINKLIDELSEVIDDIDGSLFQLSQASEKVPNFEYSSSFVISDIKDKIQAFSYMIGFLAKDLANNEEIKKFVGVSEGDSKLKDNKPADQIEKPEEEPEEKPEEMEVKEPAKPKKVENFLSVDDMIDNLANIIHHVEKAESNMDEVGNGILYIYKNTKSDKTKEHLLELNEKVKDFYKNKDLIILREKIPNILNRKNEIIKNKSLSEQKYISLVSKYRVIVEIERDIIYKYRTLYNSIVGIEEDKEVPLPPEPVKEDISQLQKEDEGLASEGNISKNIIVTGTLYTGVVESFLQKYAAKPSTYQKFITSLNTMLMHFNSSIFGSDKAKRILKFRKSLLTLKDNVLKIMGAIKSTAGVQGDPQKEIDRWNKIIREYNNFTELYNELILTDISSRLSGLNQDLNQQRSLSITPQSMVSKNTFNMAVNSAKRTYQPAKFVLNKLPNMESLIKQYTESGKIWGIKKKSIE